MASYDDDGPTALDPKMGDPVFIPSAINAHEYGEHHNGGRNSAHSHEVRSKPSRPSSGRRRFRTHKPRLEKEDFNTNYNINERMNEYSGLKDRYLEGYFQSPIRRHHLMRMGFLTRSGEILNMDQQKSFERRHSGLRESASAKALWSEQTYDQANRAKERVQKPSPSRKGVRPRKASRKSNGTVHITGTHLYGPKKKRTLSISEGTNGSSKFRPLSSHDHLMSPKMSEFKISTKKGRAVEHVASPESRFRPRQSRSRPASSNNTKHYKPMRKEDLLRLIDDCRKKIQQTQKPIPKKQGQNTQLNVLSLL